MEMAIPNPLAVAKSALRKEMKQVLKGISARSRAEQSAAVTAKLLSTEEYKRASGVAIYLSMKDEIDTFEILKDLLSGSKRCYVPRYFSDPSRPMEMVRLHDMADYESLPLTKWNIRQPPENDVSREVVAPATAQSARLDLVLVPGLAFTAAGKRLGRGRGYYDAFLSSCDPTSTATVALAFDQQVLKDLPAGERDFAVGRVISPG